TTPHELIVALTLLVRDYSSLLLVFLCRGRPCGYYSQLVPIGQQSDLVRKTVTQPKGREASTYAS
ncbi:MAG: hypothetical protein KAW89_06125, partial [Armatimonadetes bacterium]|nr:hypothetical protein [Armatimonadota bacterium]